MPLILKAEWVAHFWLLFPKRDIRAISDCHSLITPHFYSITNSQLVPGQEEMLSHQWAINISARVDKISQTHIVLFVLFLFFNFTSCLCVEVGSGSLLTCGCFASVGTNSAPLFCLAWDRTVRITCFHSTMWKDHPQYPPNPKFPPVTVTYASLQTNRVTCLSVLGCGQCILAVGLGNPTVLWFSMKLPVHSFSQELNRVLLAHWLQHIE